MTDTYDVIIVGGGTTGCVLATRLSENPDRSVLLIEAGKHYPTIADFPEELANASSLASAMPGHPNNWSFVGNLLPDLVYPLARGKVVGGSSAVNGTYFIRGRREDFDSWAALGNTEWAYDKVVEYFAKSERDLDYAGDGHGTDGPMPVKRSGPADMRPVSKAFHQACLDLGYPEDPDKNSDGGVGVGPIPRNCIDGVRMNTAVTYLAQALDRPNLTIVDECHVDRVLFEGTTAVGVAASRNGSPVTYRGSEVVLCASGIKSPHLLLLSGIGPAADLEAHGIPVVVDSPGVGKHVRDHPSVFVLFHADNGSVGLSKDVSPLQVCLNYTAPGSQDVGDMQINCTSATFAEMMTAERLDGMKKSRVPSYLKRPISTLKAIAKVSPSVVLEQARTQGELQLMCSVDFEHSEGTITLQSADPRTQPRIDLNFLTHPDDLPRLRHAVRTSFEIIEQPSFKALNAKIVSPDESERATDEALDAWIRKRLRTSFHTSCSVRMGADDDPDSVVDQYCRVKGVTGLRVADISISPTIVRRGPNATAVMIGERVAAFFEADR